METSTRRRPGPARPVRGAGTGVHRALVRLVALAVASALGAGAVYLLAVRTELGQRVDGEALDGRRIERPDAVDTAQDVLDTIGISSLALAGGAVVAVGAARGRWRLGAAAGVAIVGANVTTQLLKYRVLERPELLEDAERLRNTLPSGHTTVAMSLAVGAVLVVPARLRGAVAVVGVGYASAVGAATLVGGWHRPSDVVAAVLVAVGWGAGAAAGLVVWRGTEDWAASRSVAGPPAIWALVGAGAAVLTATTAVAVAVLAVSRGADVAVTGRGVEFVLGLAVIAGVALLAIGVLLAALRGVELDPRRPPPDEMFRGSAARAR